jgi:putative ABC transport system ATP-binding protein
MEFRLKTETCQVLKDIDIAVRRGDIHLLIGPSGSGKSTLLSILVGVLHPTKGSVSLLGQEITRLSQAQLTRFRLENIGFIFQSFNLFPALTALENVEVALNLREIWGREARQRALYFLEAVGLADRSNHRPCELSCGQQQRVAIARAIVGDPKILIADEPTSALDFKAGQSVIELLCHLSKDHQRTLLIVTHDLDSLYIADQVTYLEDGQLREVPMRMNR